MGGTLDVREKGSETLKLTWLGGNCLRVHVGGRVICFYPKTAASRFTQVEILGAVDDVFDLETPIKALGDSISAHRPVQKRLIDSEDDADIAPTPVLRMPCGHVLLLDEDEPALVLVSSQQSNEDLNRHPRDLENCVLMLHGADEHELAFITQLVRERRVKQISVAMVEPSDAEWAALVSAGQGIPMQLLEMGLALEV